MSANSDFRINFRSYCDSELQTIYHPTRNTFVQLHHMDEVIDLFYMVLDYEVNDSELTRVSQNFENDFCTIYSMQKEAISSAIEGLATNLESFLKIIALIKYKDSVFFNKLSDEYLSIQKSSLSDIIRGIIPKKDPRARYEDAINYPEPLLEKSGVEAAIYQHVTSDLRNNVHYAKKYPIVQQFKLANLVIASYLLATNFNRKHLKVVLSPEFEYLKKIIKNKGLANIKEHHIPLSATADVSEEFESLTPESLISEMEDDEGEEDNMSLVSAISDSVDIEITIGELQHLLIVGTPGSGKTTTLKNILYNNANAIFNGTGTSKFPVYLDSARYTKDYNFYSLITESLGGISLNSLYEKYEIIFLVDGLNEIHDAHRQLAITELSNLISQYHRASFAITSRRYGVYNKWKFPIYEVNKLTSEQVLKTIESRLTASKATIVFEIVSHNTQLGDLIKIPLMLFMLIRLANHLDLHDVTTKTKVLQLFYEGLLIRERKIDSIDTEILISSISRLSYHTRLNGNSQTISLLVARKIIAELLSEITRSYSAREVLNKLVDLGFLLKDEQELRFVHETVQEYFSGLELLEIFTIGGDKVNYTEEKWIEPLIVCMEVCADPSKRNEIVEHLVSPSLRNVKRFCDFSSDDFNTNIYIVAKLAFGIKQSNPIIYRKVESIISNYVILYDYLACLRKELPDYTFICRATAALSSKSVFEKIFLTLAFVGDWFYYTNSHELLSPNEITEKVKADTQIFIEDLQSYSELFSVIVNFRELIQECYLPGTVLKNVRAFLHRLKHGMPIEKLFAAYRTVPSVEILVAIGAHDCAFLLEHYDEVSHDKNTLASTLLKYHKNDPYVQEVLISFLEEPTVNSKTKLKIIISSMELEQKENLLSYVADIRRTNEIGTNLLKKLRKSLCKVPLPLLYQNNIADIFFEANDVPSFPEDEPIIDIKKPQNYHPDYILSNDKLLASLTKNISEASVSNFITKVGITHRFLRSQIDYNIGIVLRVSAIKDKHLVIIYNVLKMKILRRIVEVPPLINDVFVIEYNDSIYPIDAKQVDGKFYAFGTIMSYNAIKQEGFIRSYATSSYLYFSRKNCIDIPHRGQYVRFIAGVNAHRKFLGRPVAYRVERADRNFSYL